MAQHAIDLMGMLLEKTRGNLSLEEQRYLGIAHRAALPLRADRRGKKPSR